MTAKEFKPHWELIASPGHVLLARVDAYRLKFGRPIIYLFLSIFLALIGFVAAPYLASRAAAIVAWVVEKTSSAVSSKPPETSPAPSVNLIKPTFPRDVGFDKTILPKLATEVAPAMEALIASVQKGEKFSDCDFTKKITDVWSDGVDMTPKCRYSKDLTRIWVWSVVLDEAGGARPFIGLVAKRDGKTEFYNVDIPRMALIAGKPSIKPSLIPRAIAADFSELI